MTCICLFCGLRDRDPFIILNEPTRVDIIAVFGFYHVQRSGENRLKMSRHAYVSLDTAGECIYNHRTVMLRCILQMGLCPSK